MQTTNKRPLPEADLTQSLPSKRARQGLGTILPSIKDHDSKPSTTRSSPTLVGSSPAPIPPPSLISTSTDWTESATSADTSTSETSDIDDDSEFTTTTASSSSSSSSDASSEISIRMRPLYPNPTLRWQQLVAEYQQDDRDSSISSTTTSSSGSISSNSASLSSSSVSTSSSSSKLTNTSPIPNITHLPSCSSTSTTTTSSSSPSSGASTPKARNPTPTTKDTLTARNLFRLQRRLDALLPKIDSANKELEKDRREGRLAERNIENLDGVVGEESGEEKGYVEMDLGLGVLEEKGGGGGVGGGDMDGEEDGLAGTSRGSPEYAVERLLKEGEERKRARKSAKVKIEEVGGG